MNCVRVGKILAATLVGVGIGSADASVIPVTLDLMPEGANHRLSYRVNLEGSGRIDGVGTTVADPVYFTIYDFAGFVPGSNTQPTDWAFSYQHVGATPGLVNPADDPLVYNLTWRYTGTATLGAGLGNELPLGLFTALTTYPTLNQLGQFSAATTKDSRRLFEDGTPMQNVGYVSVPIAPVTAPEPGTLALMGLGAVGLLGGRLRSRQKKRASQG